MNNATLNEDIKRQMADDLANCVLAMYDIRGKQKFIYRSTHIKEIVGGSAIIRDCFKDYLYPAAETITENGNRSRGIFYISEGAKAERFTLEGLYRHLYHENYIGEVVYEGGGNFLLIFKNRDLFKEVTYRFTKALMFGTSVLEKYGSKVSSATEKPGTCTLKVLGTYIEHLDFTDYRGDNDRLYAQHRVNEASESINTPSGSLPIVQVSYDTSMPLTNRRPDVRDSKEKITAESYAKYTKYRDEVRVRGDEIGEKVLDKIIKKKGEDSLLSVIYFDGNGMGAKVEARTGNLKSYEECVNELREFSKEIQETFITEPLKRIDQYLKDKYGEEVKRRIVVGAGDEFTIICNAHDAYDIMRVYLEGLPDRHSSCAGAAIFHSHAPYNEAYRIAEECCENCKKHMRDKKITEACFMDFHYCQSGIGISLEKIREHEVGECISKPWLVLPKQETRIEDTNVTGQDTYKDNTTLTGHENDRLVAKMADFLRSIGRSNVKGLADYAKKGRVDLELELHRIEAHMEKEKRKQTDFEFIRNLDKSLKPALFYDVSIMYDLWFADNN